jgi:tRNA (guanine37-N1)-methyltransferase
MQQGNLGEQLKWKRQQSLLRTLKWRQDLLEKAKLSDKDREFLKKHLEESDSDKRE